MADNPLEQLVESLAPEYVAMVERLVPQFAPARPWWTEHLTPEQQLWRWETGPRDQIVGWLQAVAPYLGRRPEEGADLVEEVYTSREAEQLIPQPLVDVMPPALLEMVQAAGPVDAARHIAKMEAMRAGRAAASVP